MSSGKEKRSVRIGCRARQESGANEASEDGIAARSLIQTPHTATLNRAQVPSNGACIIAVWSRRRLCEVASHCCYLAVECLCAGSGARCATGGVCHCREGAAGIFAECRRESVPDYKARLVILFTQHRQHHF
jgi:hypothetical protein